MGQLSGMALTTCVMPAWTAACESHTCVPTKGTSLSRSRKIGTQSSAFFWSPALYESFRNPSELRGSQ